MLYELILAFLLLFYGFTTLLFVSIIYLMCCGPNDYTENDINNVNYNNELHNQYYNNISLRPRRRKYSF